MEGVHATSSQQRLMFETSKSCSKHAVCPVRNVKEHWLEGIYACASYYELYIKCSG